jgi:hypothetical protein
VRQYDEFFRVVTGGTPTDHSALKNYFPSLSITQYCEGDKIEKNEMGWACGTYGGRERCAQARGKESIGETKA